MTTPEAGRRDGGRPGVLIVGGGTVGHLAPGFAVGEVLAGEGVVVHFATPGEARERAWFPADGPAPHTATASRFPRRPWAWPVFGARLLGHVRRARRLLAELEPGVVLALGGWPCVPAALAARSKKIPLCLLASDASPGLAVRKLAPLAARIYVAWDSAGAALGAGDRVRVTGPALRRQIVDAQADPAFFGLAPDRLTLFVTGGSLGAQALNERMAEGIRRAVEAEPALAGRIQVLHSVGHSGEGVAEAYEACGIRHHVTPFVAEMGVAYRSADLVVSRAGALTCAELGAAGTPAVLVPYPHHADRQQYRNAEALTSRGAAVLAEEQDLDPEGVRRLVLDLLLDADRRARMGEAMREGFPDGAHQIAVDLVRLLKGTGGASSAPAAP